MSNNAVTPSSNSTHWFAFSVFNILENPEAYVKGVVQWIDNSDNNLTTVIVDEPLAIDDENKKKEIYDALLRKPNLTTLDIGPDESDEEEKRFSIDISMAIWLSQVLDRVTTLKTLCIKCVDFDNEPAEIVARALRRNRTLEEFCLAGINDEHVDSDACDIVVQATAYSLRFRSSLKSFIVNLHPLSETTYTAIAEALQLSYSSLEVLEIKTQDDLPAQIGANLLNAIATNKTLKEILLNNLASDTDNIVGSALSRLFSNNATLQEFSLHGPFAYEDVVPGPDDDDGIDVTTFASSLASNTSLKYFGLNGYGIGDRGIHVVCNVVMENANILRLGLVGNNFGVEGLKAIKDLLAHATALSHMVLSCNRINDENVSYICEPLETNNSLRALSIDQNDIGDMGIRTIIDTIKMNSTITYVDLGDQVDTALEDELQYHLELNKGARRLLSASPPLPLSLWPRAFKKADDCRQSSNDHTRAPDVLYYLVKAKADLFSGIPPNSRKPKRKRRRKNW